VKPNVGQVVELAIERLSTRLLDLEGRLTDEETWAAFLVTLQALTRLLEVSPGRWDQLLTTKQMAARLNVSARTLLRKRRQGVVAPAIQLGERGRGALRWRREVAR
jgi:hypothetical protein